LTAWGIFEILPAFNKTTTNQIKNNMIAIKTIDTLRNSTKKGCRFVGFLYQSKTTGEVAQYCINLGVDYVESLQHDLDAITKYAPKDELEEQAKESIIVSLQKTLAPKTIEEQKEHDDNDPYDHIGKGLKQHKENGTLYIWGFQHSKTQVEPPTEEIKEKKSSKLTIVKEKLKKDCKFKSIKFRQYILAKENIAGIVVNGEPVEVQG
jgi:hypothetical protein